MRRKQLPFWTLMDAAAPGLALGILLGRIGDLVVGDHLGEPTDFVLGFRCTDADTASRCVAPLGEGVHQPALYDMANAGRSEEHTSELQSLMRISYAVFCLKKKN